MKLKCIFGLHCWETIREVACTEEMGSFYRQFDFILFQRCAYCPEVRAMGTNGIVQKKMSVGMAARSVIKNIPRYAHEPFLKKLSTL